MSRFVRFSEQSEDYRRAVELMRNMGPEHAHRAYAEASWDRWKKMWADQRGVTESRGHPCIWRLAGKRCDGLNCFPPMADHCSLWVKNRKPYVFVSQPYPSTPEDIQEAMFFAEAHNLILRIGTWPSWHFPGSVLMMEYYRKESAVSNKAWGP